MGTFALSGTKDTAGFVACFLRAYVLLRAANRVRRASVSATPTMFNTKEISRRNFCVHACQAASCLAVGSLVQACGGGGGSSPSNVPQLSVINGNVSGSTVVVQIDSSSPLAPVGGAAMVRSSGGLFLVARTGQETFSALTSTCTHQACTITGFDSTNFVCPCHGSRFSPSGRVLNGPANAPLRTFSTQFSNNVLTISL
jgi:cytochrome b6-f complex iron-sulfur subunit